MKPDGSPLERRRHAAQATLDEFSGKPFRFGERDCARLVAFHLRQLGHTVQLPPKGSYRTARTAKRKLQERGHETIADAVDALGLQRIAPANAMMGDVVEFAATDDLGALAVLLGNGRAVAYHPDAPGAVVIQPTETPIAAWRVETP